MPINIINDPNRNPWHALSGGLGNILGGLAASKLNQISERHRRSEQRSLFEKAGYSPEQADLLSSYGQHPAEQLKLAQMLGGVAPQQQTSSFMEQPQVQQAQEQVPQWMQGLQQLRQAPSPEFQAQQSVSQRLGLPELPTSQFGRQLSEAIQQGQLQPELVAQQPKISQPMAPAQQQASVPVNQQAPKTVAQQLGSYENPQQKLAREKMEQRERLEQEKLSRKESEITRKETKEYYDKVSALNEAAKENDQRLNKMEKLIEKGKLPPAAFYNLFKNLEEMGSGAGAAAGAGIGAALGSPGGLITAGPAAAIGGAIGGIVSPIATLIRSGQKILHSDTEQFEKLSNDFVRSAKSIFGSRITDADLRVFMSMIPTLSQTDKGKRDIINNMKSFNKANEVKYKTMRNIIKENKGIRPANLQELVEDRAKPELDRISQQFLIV